MPTRSLFQRCWYWFVVWAVRVAGVVLYRVRHTGIENIPATGAVLLVSNHQSHFDPPLIACGSRRQMNFLARRTLFDFGPFGKLIASVDAIPIDRQGIGLSGIKESLRRLKRGEMLLLFPEGTRTADGRMTPFMPGFTSLAVRSHAAIVPVAIEGAYQAWPRYLKFPRGGRVRVHYGPPITPEVVAGMDDRALLALIEQRVGENHRLLRHHPQFSASR